MGFDMEKRLAQSISIYNWMIKHEAHLKAPPDPNGLDDNTLDANREIMS